MNILITGCSRGIGKSLLNSFLKIDTVKVFPHYRVGGVKPGILICDLNELGAVDKVSKFIQEYDIDTFINNASIYQKKPSSKITNEDISSMVTSNVNSQLLLLTKVASLFRKKPSRIVNINSIASKNFSSEEALYCVTKNAVGAYLNCLARDGENSSISITNIYLGGTKSDMTKERSDYNTLIDPDELGDFIAALCSQPLKSFAVTEIEIRKKWKTLN